VSCECDCDKQDKQKEGDSDDDEQNENEIDSSLMTFCLMKETERYDVTSSEELTHQ